MIKPNERFHFNKPILNTTNISLIRLSVNNSVFNVNRRNNQFLYSISNGQGAYGSGSPASVEPLHGWAKPHVNKVIIPGAYELIELAELIKEATNGNVIIEPDKNTLKCKMEVQQGVIIFVVENSVASLLGFGKQIYSRGKYTTNKIIDIMGFKTINIHCNIISGAKDNGKDTDILYTFYLTEPPGYMIINIPKNVFYQNVTKDRIEYIEFQIKDEHGRPIDLNGDVLSFTLHLT